MQSSASRSWAVWRRIRGIALRICRVALLLAVAMLVLSGIVKDTAWQRELVGIALLLAAFGVLCMVLGLVAAAVSWWAIGPPRPHKFTASGRREHFLAVYDEAVVTATLHRLLLIRVQRVYQRARRGTKAVVELPDGRLQDAWFWGSSPRTGQVLMVRSEVYWGSHNQNHVLYVGTEGGDPGIAGEIPAAAWHAHRRRGR
jgi:hypothetical protein